MPGSQTPSGDSSTFDAAFAAAAASSTDFPPAETPPVEAPAAETPPAETLPVEAPAAETPPAETPAAETPTTEAPASETPPPPPAPAAPTADEIVRGLADLIQQPQKAPPAPAPAAPPADVQIYTPDEVGVLQEYEKNWPDVAAAESLKRRAEYHDLMKFVFTEVHNFVSPMMDQLRTMGNTMHLGELKQAVPDYSENLEAEVAGWVDTQPSYLQAGMRQVMQTGTSEEVADLIGRYRAATGAAPASQAPASAPAPAPAKAPKTELSSAAKQAAESLAPVSGDRTQIPVGQDPMDFESAFARYAADPMQT